MNYSPEQLAFLRALANYQHDPKTVNAEIKEQFQQIKRDIEKATTVVVTIYGKKLKHKMTEYLRKTGAVNEMKAILDDREFQFQLSKAKPGTEELLNCIIMDAT